ncbi:MAG TPA: NlpC/P60 family protein [Candidatus Udaeobacter sp.]|jgi:cell wall-associated NlpC family hydrolase|nr:NlpC/P60 family protein [Candidatus Udaeobacter sp.]
MKWLLILSLLLSTASTSPAAEESLGKKIKKILAPTPTPNPGHKHRKSSAKKATPTATPTPKKNIKRKKASPTPTPEPEESPSATPSPQVPSTSERGPGKKGWPNVSLSPDQIAGYENNSPKVQQILDSGLMLTKQNLSYTYGSADPKNGGMDCSGFIYYVLQQNGFRDVPRDSSQQYVWVRKAGDFNAVLSRKEDSFELNDLKPGDLLFWRGTYNIDRDPPITHTMIYLGREKRTNKRVMVGSSDGRTYDGKQRWGVSVFDFKMPPPPQSGDAKISPVFVGYGRIPGLTQD